MRHSRARVCLHFVNKESFPFQVSLLKLWQILRFFTVSYIKKTKIQKKRQGKAHLNKNNKTPKTYVRLVNPKLSNVET